MQVMYIKIKSPHKCVSQTAHKELCSLIRCSFCFTFNDLTSLNPFLKLNVKVFILGDLSIPLLSSLPHIQNISAEYTHCTGIIYKFCLVNIGMD